MPTFTLQKIIVLLWLLTMEPVLSTFVSDQPLGPSLVFDDIFFCIFGRIPEELLARRTKTKVNLFEIDKFAPQHFAFFRSRTKPYDCVSQIHISRSAGYLKEFFGNGESQTEPFELRMRSLQFISPSPNDLQYQQGQTGKVKVRFEIRYPKSSKSASEIQSIVNRIRTEFESGVVPLGTITTNSEKTPPVYRSFRLFFSLPRFWPFLSQTPISANDEQ
jgi:hypothetical protein